MVQRKITQGLVPRIAIGVFGLLTVAMILLAIFDERGALALGKRRADLENLNTEIEKTIENNKALQSNIYNLLHDPDAIERRAREQLKLVKPGEIVIETRPTTESSKKDQTKQAE
jgi:cell division protein FtsB